MSTKRNRLKNPDRWEADQFAIYRFDEGVQLGPAKTQLQHVHSRTFTYMYNLQTSDFKSDQISSWAPREGSVVLQKKLHGIMLVFCHFHQLLKDFVVLHICRKKQQNKRRKSKMK